MWDRYFVLMMIVGSLLTLACTPNEEAQHQGAQVKASKANLINETPMLSEVTRERTDLLFMYQDQEGMEQRAITIDEIPQAQRHQVQVVDLARSPTERSASAYLQIFDLSKADAQGKFKGRLVSRQERDRVLANEQALPTQPPIVLYTTSWCGVCKKARRFMQSQGWAFVEKDIEKDASAKKELEQKARRAQLSLGGVPVIDVGGRLMSGFDQEALMKWVSGS